MTSIRHKATILSITLISLFYFISCFRGTVTPSPSEIAPTPSRAEYTPLMETWQREWENTLQKARAEGLVVVHFPASPEARVVIPKAFYEKYGIKVEGIFTRGAELPEKLSKERQAGLYTADIFIGGATTITTALYPMGWVEKIEPLLLLPEVKDPKVWWKGRLPILAYGSAFSMVKGPSTPLLVNSKFVQPEEIKSYWDLLNPKYKGKIVMDHPIIAGKGLQWSVFLLTFMERGEEFLRSLVKQEPVITTDRRLISEWVAREKYWIALNPRPELTTPFIELGAPLKFPILKEGDYVTSAGGNISVYIKAPHPNAAKIFLNWILTREASYLWSRAHQYQSSRIDVQSDHIEPYRRRSENVTYFEGDSEEWEMKKVQTRELLRDIYAPVLER